MLKMTEPDIAREMLSDIRADPKDMGLRLLYSDWLDEQCDQDCSDRAEFIRIQCEWRQYELMPGSRLLRAGQVTDMVTFRRLNDLVAREDQLMAKKLLWSEGLPDLGDFPEKALWYWSGGFVANFVCDGNYWLEVGPTLLAHQPVEKVSLTVSPGISGSTRYWRISQPGILNRLYGGIPREIYNYLSRGVEIVSRDGGNQIGYPDESEAIRDLSDACIEWAKDSISSASHPPPAPTVAPFCR